MSLTEKAIAKMLNNDVKEGELLLVEGTEVVKSKSSYLRLNISDGEESNKAVVDGDLLGAQLLKFAGSKEVFKLLVSKFVTHVRNKKKYIEIEEFTLVNGKTKELPSKSRELKLQHLSIGKNSLKMETCEAYPEPVLPPSVLELPSPKLLLSSKDDVDETAPCELKDLDVKSFEKIEDLYQGLYGWQLLVRVIDKTYRQFTSKQGKQIQMLSIQFIDRVGFMIDGILFGQQAKSHDSDIEIGRVYRVTRARLQQQNQKRVRSDKHSKFVLKFVADSSIVEVGDVAQIPYCSNNFIRLSQITSDTNLDEEFNVVGILISIEEEKTILKPDKLVIMQHLKIGDPISNVVMQAIVWNRQVVISPFQMLNKTVLLKHFKVSKYKQALNLTSSFRSEVVKHDFFEAYEGMWQPPVVKKESVYQKAKSLKNLADQLKHIREGQTILSDIIVWAEIIFGPKWYYESCPNIRCKKAVIAYSDCPYCSYHVEQSTKRFTLTVQLHDFTGSIYVTAFEQAASVFLKNLQIEYLAGLSEGERKAVGDKMSFENYRMKVSSRMDGTGRIRHNIVGLPESVDVKEECVAELQLIKVLKRLPVYLELKD